MVPVDIGPPHGEELAEPKTTEQGDPQRQFVTLGAQGTQEDARLIRSDRTNLGSRDHRSVDGVHRIYGDGLPPDGVRHCPMKDGVDFLDRSRSETASRAPVARDSKLLLESDDVMRPELL